MRSFICIRQGYLLLQSCEGHSPTISGELVDVADLKNIDFKHNLPRTGMLYFFCYESHFKEEGDFQGAGRVLYYDVSVDQLKRTEHIEEGFTQCEISFESTYKLPELFTEDEEDSDRFLQLFEELIPDHDDNHQVFGEPFSVQNDVFQEAGEYIGINRHDMVLLFQVDSDYNNCNMMWGDLRMLYF
ncbi:Protein of unknown function DUF1963 [Bacillus cytotoxicus NVH 391-98]|uniref:DUF1963 domain-containing protein n=1 Tax=Bacillus cytotoxicus (strain DSM 22905 / CIP 110041 / 391-98 / NVH 391-98) TaxID=315749 RepID=A7GNW3_BACCN|nr:Protein of unknown function DUF1963 [Bacillus cytotoxicus NVH 391-98]